MADSFHSFSGTFFYLHSDSSFLERGRKIIGLISKSDQKTFKFFLESIPKIEMENYTWRDLQQKKIREKNRGMKSVFFRNWSRFIHSCFSSFPYLPGSLCFLTMTETMGQPIIFSEDWDISFPISAFIFSDGHPTSSLHFLHCPD